MNIINKLISVGIVFTFTGVFLPAIAQSEEVPLRGPASFASYDKDGSGSISEAEFNAAHKERMAARAAEGKPMRGAANPPSFSDFDSNGDGQLSHDELTAGQKARKAERQGAAAGQGKGMKQGCCGGGQGGCKGCGGGGMGKGMKQGGASGGMGKDMKKGCCGGGMGKGMKQGGATGGMGKEMKKGCCGGGGMGKGMKGGCKMNMSKVRHHFVMQNGINKRYVDKINTLQDSPGNVKVGKRLYEQNCASCHGLTGQGDGEAGRGLNPGPTNIAMFSKMPMASDGYMLWTVAEGGAPLQTAMPAFKNSLTADEIWKIVIYLRQL